MVAADRRDLPRFHHRHDSRRDSFLGLGAGQLGPPVQPPGGLYSCLHHRTRLHRAYQQAWDDNGIKHLALTGSPVEEQRTWHDEIEEFFDVSVEYPGGYDPDLRLSRNFGMLHDKESSACVIRKSFILDPAMRVHMISEYPLFVGRNIDELLRVIRALQLRAETGAATPADWHWGDVAIIADNRTEADVIRQFRARSAQLMPYLRVVDPTQT